MVERSGATQVTCIAARDSPRRSSGREQHDAELNQLEREFLAASRAGSGSGSCDADALRSDSVG